MHIILLGAPGSGKGTQASALGKRLGAAHVSSGDLFREEQGNGTELGLLAKGFMERGELVPDEVTINMILGRIKRDDAAKGYILDGFPRNLAQGRALDEALASAGEAGIDSVVFMGVSETELMKRLGGRWLCRAQQHPYHVVSAPPKVEGICDIDGTELYQRSDDSEETARRRLEVYNEKTVPLVDYYREKGLLVEVDGERSIEDVGKQLTAVL